MAGLQAETPVPSDIRLHKLSKTLELVYDDLDERYVLSCEYLRVFTPSAEARGHAPGQEILQTGCQDVAITRIEPIGNYALRFVFSDGHDTGLYSWDLLYDLCRNHDALWQNYLKCVELAGASRSASAPPIDLNSWRHRVGQAHGHEHND